MRPEEVLSRASIGSPASPSELAGNVPPSVHVTPLSVERDHPVKCEPKENEPESLKPTMMVLPNDKHVVSLWVNPWLQVNPSLLLIKTLTPVRDLGTMAARSAPGGLTGPGIGNASRAIRTR